MSKGTDTLAGWCSLRSRIDLLTLSHFDWDHISGVCELIKRFRIGTLMLPYMPLTQRLEAGFEEGHSDPNDPLTPFFLNPVAFFLAQGGPGIERFLFVLPSGGDGPAPQFEPPKSNEPAEGETYLDFDRDKPESGEEYYLLQSAAQNTPVEFLRRGSAITVRGCRWEFVPYNDDPEDPIDPAFAAAVATQRDKLLTTASDQERAAALENLQAAYDDQFGVGSYNRNVISLFLYSGPIYASWRECRLQYPDWRLNASLLYSGDGYLDTARRLDRLVDFMHSDRIKWTGIFQVMHHGAETNWHKGVADAIRPGYSVFSSDPENKKLRHPHGPVLRDFWPYGAAQVDKIVGFSAGGRLIG